MLWRHCRQSGGRQLISFLIVVHVYLVESKWAWLLILTTCVGHSQFPSALNGSVYSELWEADEALSFLILQAQSDGGGGTSSAQRTKCQTHCYTSFIWDSSTLAKHMKTAYGVYISQDKLISPLFPDIFLFHAIANILMIHWNKHLNGIFKCVLCL